MGRIRKALSITSVIATGGAIGTPVKWESSAEKAAREQAELIKEQNQLLAQIARNGQGAAPRATAPMRPAPRQTANQALMVCLDCLNAGCDKNMDGKVGWTRSTANCGCPVHH